VEEGIGEALVGLGLAEHDPVHVALRVRDHARQHLTVLGHHEEQLLHSRSGLERRQLQRIAGRQARRHRDGPGRELLEQVALAPQEGESAAELVAADVDGYPYFIQKYGEALWDAADAANLDLRLFIINNGVYGIVDKGLEVVIPDVEKRRYHSTLPSIDFVGAARAHGWDGFRVKADLSNLKEIMDACYETKGQSIVIDVPVDADQVIGLNPRLNNLTTQTYL